MQREIREFADKAWNYGFRHNSKSVLKQYVFLTIILTDTFCKLIINCQRDM